MGPTEPLMVQSDGTLMLHTVHTVTDATGRPVKDEHGRPVTAEHPRYQAARDALAPFAELEKSPDYLHTYRVTAISIWNAAALGVTAEEIERTLDKFSCVPVPPGILERIRGWLERYGLLRIERVGDEERFRLVAGDPAALEDVLGHTSVRERVEVDNAGQVFVHTLERGTLKQVLIRIGYPVDDCGGFVEGDPLDVRLRTTTLAGEPFGLRDYQQRAA
ncbi:MAG: helicase-associated domain-containing protein, partial [Planctomycetota bacterium]|nr:helicase-associated domain-containing protein [Planctomycetota bacterium]